MRRLLYAKMRHVSAGVAQQAQLEEATLRPEISVILPVFNAERTLAASVESVLQQSFNNFELIAIDDGSTDRSGQILRSFRDPRIRVIEHQSNRGLVAALNDGLQEAAGALIARQDADDVSMPIRFALQRAVLAEEPRLGAVGAALQLVRDGTRSDVWSYPLSPTAARWQALFKTPVAHSVAMFRRNCAMQVGGYSETFKYAEDYDLWSRLLKVADIKSLPAALLNYSLDPAGISRSKSCEQRAVHCEIAARNMQELLGTAVPPNIVRILATDIDMGEVVDDRSEVIAAASTCHSLFRAFVNLGAHGNDIGAVSADCRDRYLRLVRMLPLNRRPGAIREIRALASSTAFGLVPILRALARP